MKMTGQYESPLTVRTQVQVEKGFMKASVTVKNDENGGIDEHKINTDFSGDFSTEAWDTNPTVGQ